MGRPGQDEDDEDAPPVARASQLLGIGWTRYVMRLEPMASASRAEVARWVGANIDRYALGRLEDGPSRRRWASPSAARGLVRRRGPEVQEAIFPRKGTRPLKKSLTG